MDYDTTNYLSLATGVNTPFRLQQPIPVTIDLLSSVLCCTPRNVKFILRKLEEQGFITWQPGRGRGHKSRLLFMRSIEEVVEGAFEQLLRKGKIKQGIELIANCAVDEGFRARLMALLNKQMGFVSEAESPSGLDVLRITLNRQMDKLDPAHVFTAFDAYIIAQITSTLVYYDGHKGRFRPGLAHMWEHNEAYTSYTFYLRKGVRFHHGRTLTSRDVKATFQRLQELGSTAAVHYKDIAHVELGGDYRITFELSRPNRFLLHLFSCVHMSIVPAEGDFAKDSIGTGPYRLLALNEDVLVLEANDHYYGIRPLLDRVEIWYLPEAASSVREYRLKESEPEVLSAPEDDYTIDYTAMGCRYLLFNFSRQGVQQQLSFRQAIRTLYDPQAMIRELGGRRVRPASSFLPWKSAAETWMETDTEHALESARQLLKESGYQGETLTLAHNAKHVETEEAEWLKARAAQVGLRMELYPQTDYDKEDLRLHADLVITEELLEDDWQWGMIHFFKNGSNSLYHLLLDKQRLLLEEELESFYELNYEERTKLLIQVEERMREQCWLLHGCHINKTAQLGPNLSGLHTSSFGFMDISKLWIKTSPMQEA
ncbi:ABC transporter substrate-binding protein [Paenibacillus donghaensis]|uniref:ABC transporter substrate-binding protein n=1 Tax=Paenibacillus donghaensis TaxID=414771 RepID=A0A2Z2KDB6_9BACL|nr:ABC transporter substrate-binding protein [Paenibacillus donghaensis]ASA21785.1 hypothetical protein B9T62_14000 [Paenibacillus donghaensis]